MDVNITSVDVQFFGIENLSYTGALAFLYVFFVTWIVVVASVTSVAINYYRWNNPKFKPTLSTYITQDR